ncbi:MAG: hypothetical protein O0X93_01630 [Methanocorpusculum sp.]|nr:hypothetical protein [Methanocorpusculum sp.]MDE2521845.1 hypothetical protein [Methanocorpusculum sp.]MDE2524838.1 hypothetical protein [Methanocorpusculum sp.]
MSFLNRFKKKKELKIVEPEPKEWSSFTTSEYWRPQPFKPEKYESREWSKFQANNSWNPQSCTRENPYKPSPMPKGFYDPYKRPMRFAWDEIPDDYHQIHEVGSAERIYASQKIYNTGYSSEAPGAGVLRYKRD